MGVYIKGIEMPKRCEDCFCFRHNAEYDYSYCSITSVNILGHGNARLNNCPLVEGLPSAQSEQWWTPCSEGSPKLGIRYNVTYESGEVGYADFRNKVIYGDKCIENVWDIPEYYEDDGQVVAWVPLPEPYQEVRK